MDKPMYAPDVPPSEHLAAAYTGDIDTVVEEMLRQSRENYLQIEELALECSAALTSAKAKSSGMAEQSLFRRLWNSVTGKNERLRSSIEEDRAAAQYAMQKAINSVLKECTQNRLLALAVKSKLENEMIERQSPEEEEADAPEMTDLEETVVIPEETLDAPMELDLDASMEPDLEAAE